MTLRYIFAYILFTVLVFGTLALAVPQSAYAYHEDGSFGVDFCYDAFCVGYSDGDVYGSFGGYYDDPYQYSPYYGDGLGYDDGFVYYDEPYFDPYYGDDYYYGLGGGDVYGGSGYYNEPYPEPYYGYDYYGFGGDVYGGLGYYDDPFYGIYDDGFGFDEPSFFYGGDQFYYEPSYGAYSYPQYSFISIEREPQYYFNEPDYFYRDWDTVNSGWCGAYGQCNPYGTQFSYNYY